MDSDRRITELEDALKQREKRLAELRKDRDADGAVIADMISQVQDADAMIEQWIAAFDMVQDDNGNWSWGEGLVAAFEIVYARHQDLLRKWNAMVAEYNAVVAPKRRNFGRPLQASPKQQQDVRERRKRGDSLRTIAEDTALSLRTVRTILGKADGTDRATLARLQRIAPDKFAEARERMRQRARKSLPRQITALRRQNADLIKRAKGQL